MIAAAGFAVLFLLMALGVPIGIAMAIVGVGGFAAINGIAPALSLLAHSPIRTVTDHSFALIPMFILMGAFTTASGMSRELFAASNAWLGRRRGGVALASIATSGGFAAISGSSVATAATMANIALPEMRRYGYGDRMATGVIAAGGTLGILIPPSIVLAVYGILVDQDIGRLFVAGLVPGLLAILFYMATVQVLGWLDPASVPRGERTPWRQRWQALAGIWASLALFLFVIGGIYGGAFTPTEAAAMGAVGAFLIGIARRRLPPRQIVSALVESLRTTAAVFTILIGAVLFGYFLAVTQTPQAITAFLMDLPFGRYGLLLVLLLFFLLLGAILDAMAMIILVVPIVFPLVMQLGFDPIWFGVIVVMTVEIALITPPVGMNVYVIKGVSRDVPLPTIFRGVAPFVAADLLRLALLIAFPAIVLFLPATMG